jgi:hypothetical protein
VLHELWGHQGLVGPFRVGEAAVEEHRSLDGAHDLVVAGREPE